jgi:LysM repeat protein
MMRYARLLLVLLLLPVMAVAQTEDSTDDADSAEVIENYRVRYGDMLDVIAQTLDVSLACLAGANDLINVNDLEFGQILTIPADCEPYDEIEAVIISNIEDLSATDLLASGLGRGGGRATSGTSAQDADATETPTPAVELPEDIVYTVERNDNLTKIAEAYDVTVACLLRTNNILNPDLIYTGQELVISGACQAGGGDTVLGRQQCVSDRNAGRIVSGGVYVVQAGDTLDFIGCDLNLSTTCLAETNGLVNRGGQLFIGQPLIIDARCAGWSESG